MIAPTRIPKHEILAEAPRHMKPDGSIDIKRMSEALGCHYSSLLKRVGDLRKTGDWTYPRSKCGPKQPVCDLCEAVGSIGTYDARNFDMTGLLCMGCVNELVEEMTAKKGEAA